MALAKPELDFNRDVRPILSDNCFACHGFDAANRKGKRRLDTFEGATAERNDIRAIVPGKPEESDLWIRVSSASDEELMPPKESHKTLSAAQKEILRRWIAEGAVYQPHWAYLAPRRSPPPAVRPNPWSRNGIDDFVLARLEQAGLRPSAEADRATLLRRAALDLT